MVFEARSGRCAFCTGSASSSPLIAGPSCGEVSAEHITTPFFARPKSQSTNAKEVSEHPPTPSPTVLWTWRRSSFFAFPSLRQKTRSHGTSLTAPQVIALSRKSNGHKLPEYSCLPPILVCQCNFSEEIRTAGITRNNLSADLAFNWPTAASKGSSRNYKSGSDNVEMFRSLRTRQFITVLTKAHHMLRQ